MAEWCHRERADRSGGGFGEPLRGSRCFFLDDVIKITVLGSENPLGVILVAAAAMEELGLEPVVGHVSDPARIAAYGVMSAPALVVGE